MISMLSQESNECYLQPYHCAPGIPGPPDPIQDLPRLAGTWHQRRSWPAVLGCFQAVFDQEMLKVTGENLFLPSVMIE
jgi:hypothetical protein